MPQRATFALWMAAETTDEEAWLKSVEENLVRSIASKARTKRPSCGCSKTRRYEDRVVVLEGMLPDTTGPRTRRWSVVIQRVMNGEDEEVVALDLGLFQL